MLKHQQKHHHYLGIVVLMPQIKQVWKVLAHPEHCGDWGEMHSLSSCQFSPWHRPSIRTFLQILGGVSRSLLIWRKLFRCFAFPLWWEVYQWFWDASWCFQMLRGATICSKHPGIWQDVWGAVTIYSTIFYIFLHLYLLDLLWSLLELSALHSREAARIYRVNNQSTSDGSDRIKDASVVMFLADLRICAHAWARTSSKNLSDLVWVVNDVNGSEVSVQSLQWRLPWKSVRCHVDSIRGSSLLVPYFMLRFLVDFVFRSYCTTLHHFQTPVQ